VTATLWDVSRPGKQAEADLVMLTDRQPRSFLRAVCLAWHRRAGLAFAEEEGEATLFALRRVHERDVGDEAFEAELSAGLLQFYRSCRRSVALERRLFFALRHPGANVLHVAREALSEIRQFGFRYVLNKGSSSGRSFGSLARQARVELHRLKGLIRLFPMSAGEEDLLVGRAETGFHIADLLVTYFHERFPRYRIVLLAGTRAYVSGEPGEVLTDDAAPYAEALAGDDFERFWLAYYGSQGIPRRANRRLRRQRLPRKYWSWVREAARFASDHA